MDPYLLLVLVGAFGGFVRSLIGYNQQADPGEKFSYLKMIKSLVRSAVTGSVAVYYLISPDTYDTKTYVGAFVMAVGGDVLIKEVFGTAVSLVNGRYAPPAPAPAQPPQPSQ